MAEEKKKKEKTDRTRINLSDQYEMEYWTDKLGVSKGELERAVKEVGNNAKDVKATFKKVAGR